MHRCIKIIMKTNTNLNLLCKTIASDSEDDKLTITGLASSTDQDLDGESVSYKALVQMYEKVRGLSLFLEHEHHLNSVIGTIVDAELKGTELFITAEILDNHKDFVKGLLDSNVNLGFSIGGIATFNQQDKSVMEDFNLLEVSLVSLPANWSSFGTVVEEKSVTCTCLTAGLYELKHLGEDKMDKDQIQNIEPTAEEVIKSEAMPEEAPIEEAVEKSEEAIEEVSEEVEAAPEMEEKSEDIEEDAEKAVDAEPESEEAIDEKALDSEEEEKPKFLTADDIGVILESYMAEKEEQITANVLAALQKELAKKEASVEEPAEEEAEKAEEVETEKSVETKAVEAEPVEEPVSKYASYTEEQSEEKSFLDSEERDFLGRNLKYL